VFYGRHVGEEGAAARIGERQVLTIGGKFGHDRLQRDHGTLAVRLAKRHEAKPGGDEVRHEGVKIGFERGGKRDAVIGGGGGDTFNITVNVPTGNGDDVVRALQDYVRRRGAIPVPVGSARY